MLVLFGLYLPLLNQGYSCILKTFYIIDIKFTVGVKYVMCILKKLNFHVSYKVQNISI